MQLFKLASGQKEDRRPFHSRERDWLLNEDKIVINAKLIKILNSIINSNLKKMVKILKFSSNESSCDYSTCILCTLASLQSWIFQRGYHYLCSSVPFKGHFYKILLKNHSMTVIWKRYWNNILFLFQFLL